MNKANIGKNLIISPLSIFQVLSLTSNGAKGETQSEMLELLEFNSIDQLNELNYQILSTVKKFSTVDIANSVMTRITPLQSFSNITEKYLAPVEPLISAEQVNNWCSNKTHGKINKILEDLNEDTLMLIINAVYFKGEWMIQFEEYNTIKLPFYNLGKTTNNVDTMTLVTYNEYYEDKKVQAIKLEFKEDFMSAIIILPAEGNDINKYIDTLSNSNEEYTKIIKGLNFAKVHLQLPKFEIKFSDALNGVLADLGMYNAFSPKDADFTGLRKEKDLFISSLIHKTYLKVNEQGTEAAAVTNSFLLTATSDGGEEKIFDMKVNRPFLFLLKNDKLPDGYDLLFMSKIETIE